MGACYNEVGEILPRHDSPWTHEKDNQNYWVFHVRPFLFMDKMSQ